MSPVMERVLGDYQTQLASLRAQNEQLRHQLHWSAQREERDLDLINKLAGTLAQLGQVKA